MAQRGSRARRAQVRRRYGLAGARRAVVALLVVAASAAVAGVLARQGGRLVPTGADAATSAPGAAAGTAAPDAGGAEGTGGDGAPSSSEPVSSEAGGGGDGQASGAGGVDTVVVHVDGAVAAPGVYELAGTSLRLRDAVEAAGGLAEGADTTGVNLAAPLSDGEKVHVPFEGEAAPAAVGTTAGTSSGSGVAGGLVNLNTATVEELCQLPGVGEATAQKIVADRERNGPFTSCEDLMRVSGIGEKKFENVRELICV